MTDTTHRRIADACGQDFADHVDAINKPYDPAKTPAPQGSAEAGTDPEVARIQRNMDLLCGLPDDPFAEEG